MGKRFIPLAALVLSGVAPITTVTSGQSLGDALDAASLTWTTGGSAPWVVETNVSHNGMAASAGALTGGQANWIQTIITGPAAITYWSKISTCGSGAGTLNLTIGGTLQNSISGEIDWQQHSFYVPSGQQTVLWSFNLNCTTSGAQNTAWLDEVSVGDPAPPSIVSGPTNQIVSAGTPMTLIVSASGTEPFSYQWQFAGTNLAGATQSSFSVADCQETNAGDYTVVITNVAGAITSEVATVSVAAASPIFTVEPSSQNTILGTNLSLNAAAYGSEPLSWQWYLNGTAVADATNRILSLTNIQISNGGDYVAVAGNVAGMATSQVATVTVVLAPIITQQPLSQAAAPGARVSFNSAGLGSDVLAWQWYHDGTAISGGTSSQLNVTNAGPSIFGGYWAVVTNIYGSATSQVATLSYSPVLVWGSTKYGATIIPPSATNVVSLAAGDNHMLGLRSDGTVLTWGASNWFGYYDLSDVPSGATNVTGIAAGSAHSLALRQDHTDVLWGYILGSGTNFNVSADLTNIAYQALGPGAQHALSLLSNGEVRDWGNAGIGTQNVPANVTNVVSVAAGALHSLALRANGTLVIWGHETVIPSSASNVVAISSGWYHNLALRADGKLVQWGGSAGSVPAAATNIVAFACGGNHSLALRRDGKLFAWGDNSYGQVNIPGWATNLSSVAGGSYNSLALVADGPPVLTMPLVDRSVLLSGTVYFRASAVGSWPLSYQWQFDGQDVPGATNELLTITNTQPFQGGTYSVVVTNLLGSSSSPGALLTVLPTSSVILPWSLTITNGQISFLATSATGMVWSVQSSTNLLNWSDLGFLTNTIGSMSFSGASSDAAAGFYRLRFSGYSNF